MKLVKATYMIKRSQREALRELAEEYAEKTGCEPDESEIMRCLIDFYTLRRNEAPAGAQEKTVTLPRGGRRLVVDVRRIVELNKKGMSIRKIAKELGVSIAVVQRRLEERRRREFDDQAFT